MLCIFPALMFVYRNHLIDFNYCNINACVPCSAKDMSLPQDTYNLDLDERWCTEK